MAFLHPQRVAILPHWHKDFEEWHKAKEPRVIHLILHLITPLYT